MSGECDKCNEHALECTCEPFSRRQENDPRPCYNHMNAPLIPLEDGENPPAEMPPTKWINVRGREEHEAVIKDAAKCKELGLDQMYETIVYLNSWGGWLGD